MNLKQYVTEFLTLCARHRTHSRGTIRAYRFWLKTFSDWAGEGARLDAFSEESLRRFRNARLKERDYAANTINQMVYALRAFGAWLQKEGRLEHNPALALSTVEVNNGEVATNVVDDRDAFAMLKACDLLSYAPQKQALYRATISLLIGAGLRYSELRALVPDDFCPYLRKLIVRCGKGGKRREVFLAQECIDAVCTWLEVRPQDCKVDALLVYNRAFPLARAAINRITGELAGLAGLPAGKRFNPHAWRHAYISRLLAHGENPKVVAELVGHSDVSVTLNTYNHPKPQAYQEAAIKAFVIPDRNLSTPSPAAAQEFVLKKPRNATWRRHTEERGGKNGK